METNRINSAVPFMATHPTEMIRDEIRARGMSQKELADRMDMKPSDVSRMFREKETVTSTLAAKLEIALGIRASFWTDAQANYDKDSKATALRDKEKF